MNKNCYHLQGPSGVKAATGRIRQVLQDEKPNYICRVDIKSFVSVQVPIILRSNGQNN
jgi:RNA-directed DNA polymerase